MKGANRGNLLKLSGLIALPTALRSQSGAARRIPRAVASLLETGFDALSNGELRFFVSYKFAIRSDSSTAHGPEGYATASFDSLPTVHELVTTVKKDMLAYGRTFGMVDLTEKDVLVFNAGVPLF